MRSPINIYILIPILAKTTLGIFLPVTGIQTMLIDIGVGVGSLTAANFLHQLGDDCSKNPVSTGGRILKSSTNAFAQYFGAMLFSVLVVLIPVFKMPILALSKIPGSQYVLENFVWSLGVIASTVLLNIFDSAATSQADICAGKIGATRMIVSLIVFLLAGLFQYFTL
jgi:hypothetical protein